MRSIFAALCLSVSLCACKKNEVQPESGPSLTRLRLLHTEVLPAAGMPYSVQSRAFSVTADGKIHLLFVAGDGFSVANYYRLTLAANGDSLAAPAISPAAQEAARKSGLSADWHFVPHTDKLALSYSVAQASKYELYAADGTSPVYTHTSTPLVGPLRLLANGGAMASDGYTGYNYEPPAYRSQANFFYYPSAGATPYHGQYMHSYSASGQYDVRRLGWAAELLDAQQMALAYVTPTDFVILYHNLTTATVSYSDSIASIALRTSDYSGGRLQCQLRARTSADGSHITYLLRGYAPFTLDTRFSTFIYNKTTRKIDKGVESIVLGENVAVQYDSDGGLLYGQQSNDSRDWTIYRRSAGKEPEVIASISYPSGLAMDEVAEHFGKIYVSAHSTGSVETPSKSYLMVVE